MADSSSANITWAGSWLLSKIEGGGPFSVISCWCFIGKEQGVGLRAYQKMRAGVPQWGKVWDPDRLFKIVLARISFSRLLSIWHSMIVV